MTRNERLDKRGRVQESKTQGQQQAPAHIQEGGNADVAQL